MKKLCKYPVIKWKDIPIKTRERIKRELAVPLPPHLLKSQSFIKIKEKKKNYKPHIIIMWCILISLLSVIILISII